MMISDTYIIAAITALAGALVVMFAWFREETKRCIIREKECQEKYESLLQRIAKLEPTQEHST